MKKMIFVRAAAAFAALSLALTSCGEKKSAETTAVSSEPAPAAESKREEKTVSAQIDKAAFDSLVSSIATASDAEIAASSWAAAVKKAGVLRVGTTRTSYLFSQFDETDNSVRGFDAGLFELLAQYIFGDANKYEITQVTSSTREALLQSGQVDAVFATYSITESRKKLISFAGPYYTSKQAVLVKAGKKGISGVEDLAGKTVATQSGSTGPTILAQFAPDAIVQEFKDDTEARTALQQGRIDAYVTDYTLLLNAIARNPSTYWLVGTPFGPEDNYGIGLPLGSDGVAFVNAFLKKIIADGTWEKLWLVSLGSRTGIETAPSAPVIE